MMIEDGGFAVPRVSSLPKTYQQVMGVCPQACLSGSRQALIHCSNGILIPIGIGSTLVDQVGNSRTFCRLCNEIVQNQLVPGCRQCNFLVVCRFMHISTVLF